MSFQQLLAILHYRIKLIVYVTLTTVVLAILASVLIPKAYKATTSLLVNYKYSDPISGAVINAQMMPSYMATQVDVVASKETAISVAKELKRANFNSKLQEFRTDFKKAFEDPQEQDEDNFNDWLADILLSKLDVAPSRTSSIIYITYKGSDPEFAAYIVNAFANAYIQKSINLKVDPSRSAADFFTTQIKKLQAEYQDANNKYSDFQRKNNILDIDSSLDAENNRLTVLSNQLAEAEKQSAVAQARSESAASLNSSYEVSADAIVQSLKSALALEEVKLNEISTQFSTNHPDYKASKAKVDKLKSELYQQMNATSRIVKSGETNFTSEENKIRRSYEAQKSKVLDLNNSRNQLSVLAEAVSTAQKTYGAAVDRFNQNNFEGQSDLSNIAILSKATPPRKAYFPKLKINLVLGLLMGLFLGVGFAILSELFNRKIRSDEDILSIIDAPSFGTLPKFNKEIFNALEFKGKKKLALTK